MPAGHPLGTRTELQLSETLEHRLLLPAAPLIVGEHANVLYQRQRIDVNRLTHYNHACAPCAAWCVPAPAWA